MSNVTQNNFKKIKLQLKGIKGKPILVWHLFSTKCQAESFAQRPPQLQSPERQVSSGGSGSFSCVCDVTEWGLDDAFEHICLNTECEFSDLQCVASAGAVTGQGLGNKIKFGKSME